MKVTRRAVVLSGIILLAMGVRLIGVGEPAAGFFSYNEGFYLQMASADAERGVMAWMTAPGDLNNPPLYGLVLTTLFRVFGPGIVIARIASILAAAVGVYYLFLLGRALFTERIGMIAAALYAIMPGAVLVTRNVQMDALFVTLVLAGLYHYVVAIRSGKGRDGLISGVLFGLAVLTKLPAVLGLVLLAVWETWRTRGLAWLKAPRVRACATACLVVASPWFVWQIVRDGSAFFAAMGGVAARGAAAGLTVEGLRLRFLDEVIWIASPLLLVLLIPAAGFALWRHKPADTFALTGLGLFTALYLVLRMHSYYLLPALPFAALILARGASELIKRRPGPGIVVTALTISAVFIVALLMLGGHKLGTFSPAQIVDDLPADRSGVTVYATERIMGAWGPALSYYVKPATVVALPDNANLLIEPLPDLRPAYVVATVTTGPTGGDMTRVASYTERATGVVLFGWAVYQPPRNRHFFYCAPWNAQFIGAPWFGLISAEVLTDIVLLRVE